MGEWTVAVVFLGLVAAGLVLGVRLALTQHPLWLSLPAVEAALAVAGIVLGGPRVEPVPPGAPLGDFGGGANFAQEWSAHRLLYGAPIGHCLVRRGILTCPTRYYFLEWHPENPPGWRFLGANLGLEIMALRGIAEESNPRLPPLVLAYLADQRSRGVDLVRFFGHPRTSPRPWGDRLLVYFDKAVLAWPAGAEDPALVERLPLGEIVWTLEQQGADPSAPVPWTPARIILVLLGIGVVGGTVVYTRLAARALRYAL